MAQPQNQTQNQIIKAFSDFADGHLQINSFQFGYPFEFATSGDTIFPQLFVTPLDHRYSKKTFEYNYRLIFADIVGKGERNRDDVLSDQLEIAKDLIAQLSNPDYPFIFDMSNVRLEDFFEQFSESNSGIDISGYMAEILIRVPFDNNRCFIPTDGIGITVSEDQNLVIITDANNVNSPVSINAGGTYTCSPSTGTSIIDATCAELNNATTGLTQAQRDFVYRRNPIVTGQRTSFRTDDDGDLEKGIGNTASGITDDPWFVLSCDNSFGNRFRFTDENGDYYEDTDADGIPDAKNVAGAYSSGANYIIDHLTGMAYIFLGLGTSNWNDFIDDAGTHSVLGFSDFRPVNIDELENLANAELLPTLDWQPFNLGSDFFFWSSNTVMNTTTRARGMNSTNGDNNGNTAFSAKTNLSSRIFVRNHF